MVLGVDANILVYTVLSATLELHGVTHIVTRNDRDFRMLGLTVVDPFAEH